MSNRVSFAVVVLLAACLAACAPRPALYETDVTIAVWDLDNLCTSDSSSRPDLGELLSARITETLAEKEKYSVVERERLLLALEELRLGTTSLVDEGSRLRLGKLAGARLMVFGGYQIIGDMMRVDLRLVEVESGKVLKAAEKTTSEADLSGWLTAVSQAAAELF